MARARGAASKLLHKIESVYGTAPTGNWAQLPFFSFNLGAAQSVDEDNPLGFGAGRDVGDPTAGLIEVKGNAVVPIDIYNTGTWLRLLFGTATVTGASNPYTHTWNSGTAAALPSAAFEKQFPEASSAGIFMVNTGVKAGSLDVDFSPRGGAQMSIGLMGQAEVKNTSTGGGTPTNATFTRYQRQQGTITRAGSALADIVGGKLSYSNNLEAVHTIRSDLKAEGVDEGLATVNGSITARFNATTLLDQAIAGTTAALVFAFTYDANWSLTFTIPRAFLDRPVIGVSGPGGVEATFNFRAAYDPTAGYQMQTVLKSPVATY